MKKIWKICDFSALECEFFRLMEPDLTGGIEGRGFDSFPAGRMDDKKCVLR